MLYIKHVKELISAKRYDDHEDKTQQHGANTAQELAGTGIGDLGCHGIAPTVPKLPRIHAPAGFLQDRVSSPSLTRRGTQEIQGRPAPARCQGSRDGERCSSHLMGLMDAARRHAHFFSSRGEAVECRLPCGKIGNLVLNVQCCH